MTGSATETTTDAPVNRPAVARPARTLPVPALVAGLLLLGGSVFALMAEARAGQGAGEGALPGLDAPSLAVPQPLPALPQPAAPPPPPPLEAPLPFAVIAAPPPPPAPLFDSGAAARAEARVRAPALIVDLAQAEPPRAAAVAGAAVAGAAVPVASDAPGAPGAAAPDRLNSSERFAARVGGQQVEVAEAQRMAGLDRLVPQGAIIGAVMETALNSDLPGFARAIVQRDVLSFDGSAVLIPAGSRVIGQYQSGVARGASRVFIIWTRLIRPDGVSVVLASPVIDEIGRGGIAGKVNRHFLQRYGGAILLSVLTGGLNVAAASVGGGGGAIVIGTANEATALANQAAKDLDIPPTITTKQGTAVRIFVAQDLDFSSVGPAA
jgi:type IV secretion system protein VirB10